MPIAQFNAEQLAFRSEVADFFRRECRDDTLWLDRESDEYLARGREMDRKLIDRGWFTMHWPKEYGGSGGDPMHYAILRELGGYFRVPTYGGHGRFIVGPALIAFGTEEQKQRYLPTISRGELIICLGFTEPNAGSDLGAISLKAEPEGEHFRVNGSKLYITYGHYANTMLLAARTDPTEPRYRNVSLFLMDMALPGVSISPLHCLTGHRINEVHFDNVLVLRDCLLGEPNRGFHHMAVALNFERSGVDGPARYMAELEDLVAYCQDNGRWEQPRVRQIVGALAARLEAWRMASWRVVQLQMRGEVPSWEASIAEMYRKDTNPLFGRALLEILGPDGLVERGDTTAVLHGRPEWYLRESFNNHGQGGRFVTRNVIARRGLDLPRH